MPLSTIDMVISQLEKMAEQMRDERFGDILSSMFLPPSKILHRVLDTFIEQVRVLETEIGPSRTWRLIEANDDLISLTSGSKPEQIEAARRLGRRMIRPKVLTGLLKRGATAVDMSPETFLDDVLFPEGLIVAVGQMDSSQTVRLGRKWILGKDGKIRHVRPVYDLEIGDFIRWLYQEATEACNAILLERTYPAHDPLNNTAFSDDADDLDRAVIDAGVKRSTVALEDAQSMFVTFINPGDEDPLQSEVINRVSAEKQVSKLLTEISAKERALIEESLKDDGDILALLQEQNTSPDAIRKKRERLRKLLK